MKTTLLDNEKILADQQAVTQAKKDEEQKRLENELQMSQQMQLKNEVLALQTQLSALKNDSAEWMKYKDEFYNFLKERQTEMEFHKKALSELQKKETYEERKKKYSEVCCYIEYDCGRNGEINC